MTSTSFNIGMTLEKPTSRVLAPPGGGSNFPLFGEAEVKVNSPRPKYDQQNSSNVNFCMNTTDPNVKVEQTKNEIQQQQSTPTSVESKPAPTNDAPQQQQQQQQQQQSAPAVATAAAAAKRVPPGGFSSGGFW